MTFWKDKTVLVAGGAGFVGVHLVQAISAAGADVHVLDNFSTSTPHALTALQRSSTRPIMVTHRDVAEFGPFPVAEVVFNLACPASPMRYQASPIQTWRTSVFGTYNLMQHAITCGATFVQASTSEVYGEPLSHPQRESDWGNVNPNGLRSCYDEGKRAAEAVLMDAQRLNLLNLRIARIFNTYGPGMQANDGRALPQFMAQARAGVPITLHGDGSQTRSLCYVSDLVFGLILLAATPNISGCVVNLGNPHEITMRHLAQLIITATDSLSPIICTPRPPDDPSRRCPDISIAQQLLGWTPHVSLQDGLNLTLRATAA